MAASSSTFKILHTPIVTKSKDLEELDNLLILRQRHIRRTRTVDNYSPQFESLIAEFILLISLKRKRELEILKAKIRYPEFDLHKENLTMRDHKGDTLLTWAVWKNDLPLTEALLKIENYNINAQTKGGDTALTYAVRNNHPEIALALLKSGRCDVNLVNKDLNSALILSIPHCRSEEVIRELIKNGSDLNRRNADGESPLHLAILRKNIDVALTLIEEKACDLNVPNRNNNPPILEALACGNFTIAKRLIAENRCDLDQKDGENNTLAYAFACIQHYRRNCYDYDARISLSAFSEIALRLINSPRCNYHLYNNYNNDEKTALMMAVEANTPDLLQAMLLTNRCDVNFKTKHGTALDFAMQQWEKTSSSSRNLSTITFLLAAGAKISKPRGFIIFLNNIKSDTPGVADCYSYLYQQHGLIPKDSVSVFFKPAPLPAQPPAPVKQEGNRKKEKPIYIIRTYGYPV